jgi:patatin-like phospholipase/acyl hydrolase
MLEAFQKENPKGTLGKRITILSIDGGGVRGLVPLVILIELEAILQRLDGAERRLADYFNMVAGTSTGGVITGLITTASQEVPTRALFTAKEVFDFYDRHATTLLPQTST